MKDSQRSAHSMPFGAQLEADGSVRFALWAPGARSVELQLEAGNGSRKLPMHTQGEGWFSLLVSDAGPGSRYRYRIDDEQLVPDPASRFQPEDVHGASEVIDPAAWRWHDADWTGRPWGETVLYELHTGTFSPEGSFSGIEARLDYLQELGVTAIELMPVADFPGARNWGYDGVSLFAPDSTYGRPENLKRLVDAAHARGLMVFLDVVYNHLGPEGNYLHVYAPHFFNAAHHTAWGAAINFDGNDNRPVREFFIHNALFWLEEYHLDGLRLDAVHAIADDSEPHILRELATRVREHFGEQRHIHLVLENDDNAARYLTRDGNGRAPQYEAQWNDDIHHAMHVVLTGEEGGYYADYAESPHAHLARCLSEGFAWQGEVSDYRDRKRRGEPSRDLPPTAFVNFIQNHDQIGNRAFGERLTQLAPAQALRAATATLLLAPSPPMLFMGEEFGSEQPFPFFCDFGGELAAAVTEGRRREFARFPEFRDEAVRDRIPDPMSAATFESSRLDWSALDEPRHAGWLALHRELLQLRARAILPLSADGAPVRKSFSLPADCVIRCDWNWPDGSQLILLANLAHDAARLSDWPDIPVLYSTHPDAAIDESGLPAWSVVWLLDGAGAPA